jgi:hypothetical protein
MTLRERILAVYEGRVPDKVPFMLDLSHYYYARFQKPWDLCKGYPEPERDLIDFNRKMGAGFYIPNQAHFYRTAYGENVQATVERREVNGIPEIVWRYETPIGAIERIRVWEPGSYSWAIKKWGVESEQDLRVLGYAMSVRRYEPLMENYRAWDDYVGEDGLVYLVPGYSAMGYLLHYWMGVENTVYAAADWPETMREVIDGINENNLEFIRMLSKYPARVAVMGDNFSSDVQPPRFFEEWSADYYRRAIGILHAGGKKVAVHIDGKLRNAIGMIREVGADAIDAVTPGSVGGLTPEQCREEAGEGLILSGGIPNELWYASAPAEAFERAVKDWLDLRRKSPALIAAAGDQVPPGAEEERILRMRDIVKEYGAF